MGEAKKDRKIEKVLAVMGGGAAARKKRTSEGAEKCQKFEKTASSR